MPVTLHGTNGVTFNDASIQDKAAQAVGTAPGYAARMWANSDCSGGGAGVAQVRASSNVTSLTDNGTGDYSLNITAAMPDANYVMTSTHGYDQVGGDQRAHVFINGTPTTTVVRVGNIFANVAYTDTRRSCVALFR